MKILVVQSKMGIGDMIIYLPFIDAISKKFKYQIKIGGIKLIKKIFNSI